MNTSATVSFADNIRQVICDICLKSKSGHPTSSLSATDLIAALFDGAMDWSAQEPFERDSFVLSKGHAAPALYAALYLKGVLAEKDLDSFRAIDSKLQGHPDFSRLPAVAVTTGALGQGLSTAIGLAIAKRLKGKGYSYCIIGDGESQEGQIWEAALFAGSHKINNIIAFTDSNKGQSDGPIAEILPMPELEQLWRSFGWNALTIDGHSHKEILGAIANAKNSKLPTMIIAKTKKGFISQSLSILNGDHAGQVNAAIVDQVRAELKKNGGRV